MNPPNNGYPQGFPPGYPGAPPQQAYPGAPPQQAYPGAPPQQAYPGAPPQQAYPGAPPQQAYQPAPGYPQPGPTPYQQQPHMQVGGAPHPHMPSLAGAKAGNDEGGAFLPDVESEYVIDVTKAAVEQRRKGLRFVLYFRVVESANAAVRVGSEHDWIKRYDDEFGYGMNDIKGWICQAIEALHPGSDAANNWQDGYQAYICDQTQPAAGLRFRLITSLKPKRAGGFVTLYKWEALPPGTVVGLQPVNVQAPAAPAPQQGFAPQGYLPPGATFAPPVAAPAPQGGPPPGWPAGLPWGQR